MKELKQYDIGDKFIIKCPVCQHDIINRKERLDPCEHVLMAYNDVMDAPLDKFTYVRHNCEPLEAEVKGMGSDEGDEDYGKFMAAVAKKHGYEIFKLVEDAQFCAGSGTATTYFMIRTPKKAAKKAKRKKA